MIDELLDDLTDLGVNKELELVLKYSLKHTIFVDIRETTRDGRWDCGERTAYEGTLSMNALAIPEVNEDQSYPMVVSDAMRTMFEQFYLGHYKFSSNQRVGNIDDNVLARMISGYLRLSNGKMSSWNSNINFIPGLKRSANSDSTNVFIRQKTQQYFKGITRKDDDLKLKNLTLDVGFTIYYNKHSIYSQDVKSMEIPSILKERSENSWEHTS